MPIIITINDKDFAKVLDKVQKSIDTVAKTALMEMADTLLALARLEVPHRDGILEGSGNAYWEGNTSAVAFDTEYASYQHEGMRRDGSHVIRNYGRGRKKKYLEDPLKMNISKWTEIAQRELDNSL